MATVALRNGARVAAVEDLTDAEVVLCMRNGALMDPELREIAHGEGHAGERAFLAHYAQLHETTHGAPWCLP